MRTRSKSVCLEDSPTKVNLESLSNAFSPTLLMMLGDAFEDVFECHLVRRGGRVIPVTENMVFFKTIDKYVPRLCKGKKKRGSSFEEEC